MAKVQHYKVRRHNKYNARKTWIDGHRFDSMREARRYQDLNLLERAGEIHNLRLQVAYPLLLDTVTLGKYIADFVYWEDKILIIEDCKGVRTPLYRWKKKHFQLQYNTIIKET